MTEDNQFLATFIGDKTLISAGLFNHYLNFPNASFM